MEKQIKKVFLYGLIVGGILSVLIVNPVIERESAVLSRNSETITVGGTDFVLSDSQYTEFKLIGFFSLLFGVIALTLLYLFDNQQVRFI